MSLEFVAPIRCYNGAYDSATQKVLDAQQAAMRLILRTFPDAHCTYFPAESQYQVHVWGKPLSPLCQTRGSAIAAALEEL